MKNKPQKWFMRIIQYPGLQVKIAVIFFILLLLPSSVFTYYASYRIEAVVREQTFLAARKTFEETASAIRARIDKATAVIDQLVYDDQIYSMASTDPQDYPYILQWEDQRVLASSFKRLESLTEVSDIRFYVKNDYLYSNENQYIFSMKNISKTNWYQSLANADSQQWFTPLDFSDLTAADRNTFSCMRLIYNPSQPTSPLAVLRVDLKLSDLEQAIRYSSTTKNGVVLLLDDGETALSYSASNAAPLPKTISASLTAVTQDQWVPINVGGKDYYIYRTSLAPTPWQLILAIPFSDISAVSSELQTELILVMLFVAGAAFFIAIILSDRILRRIRQLADTMQKVEAGNMKVQLTNTSNDEIGQLMTHFNHMMNRIQQLMDEKVIYGIEIKNLELKALQAQINPHFLYNTLDTINCFALQQDIVEISDLVSALAAFYKISLSKGRDIISIHDEIIHAQMYLCIQDYRFKNQIHTRWDISPEIEEMYIIKIVLQPIVENAILHGIFEREDSAGSIMIKGWIESNDIYISVSDDGVGMSQEMIDSNFRSSESEQITHASGGYGIQNINDRLRIAYGPGYGLSCISTLGVGTTVTIHIPSEYQK